MSSTSVRAGAGEDWSKRANAQAVSSSSQLPSILVHRSTSSSLHESARAVFPEHQLSCWKKAWDTWRDESSLNALRVLLEATLESESTPHSWSPTIAFSAALHRLIFGTSLFQERKITDPTMMTSSHFVTSMDWHPVALKLAMSFTNHTVSIYEGGGASALTSPKHTLKHRQMKDIHQVAWKPFSASVLAVACSEGVFIWSIDPRSFVSRVPSGCASILPCSQKPFSVTWLPKSGLLAVGSSGPLMLWDTTTTLQSECILAGRGAQQIKVSSDERSLVVVKNNRDLVVFDLADGWEWERWTAAGNGAVTGEVWYPHAPLLMYITASDPLVYVMSKSWNKVFPLVHVLEAVSESSGGFLQATGLSNLVLDPTGAFLAVSIRASTANACPEVCVAVFKLTLIQEALEAILVKTISPPSSSNVSSEPIQCLQFKPNVECGAILCVLWSLGELAYFTF